MDDRHTSEEKAFFEKILERFEDPKKIASDTEATVRCPDPHGLHSNGDERPSLGVSLSRNGVGAKVLIYCHSQGCDFDAILEARELTTKDLYFGRNGDGRPEEEEDVGFSGCTLKEYSACKNLPVEFLTSGVIGLEDRKYAGKDAVWIPYMNTGGELIAERFRVSLLKNKTGADNRFRWQKGSKTALYGLNWLDVAHDKGYVLVVEGESDCHVLWYHGLPAVGIPGAKNWRDEWAEHLDGIDHVLVCVEPDEAGESLWKAVSGCQTLISRVRKVGFSDAV